MGNTVMDNGIFWEMVPVFAVGGALLWFLVRSLLRHQGWWSSAVSGRTKRTRPGPTR
jgi:hypothetical protein